MVLEQHREQICEIALTHGDALVCSLRKHYGAHFARGCAENEKLNYVLHKLDERSLSKLLRDHKAGKLEKIPAKGPKRD
jgi:hypothetical protein